MAGEVPGKLPSVGNCYNADIRNNGTARRVTEAMQRMGFGASGFRRYSRPPGQELEKHDLYIYIDDGRDDITWLPPKPNACWLVDTHLGYDRRLAWAKEFDYVFLAQRADVERMQADGVSSAKWLPLACSAYLDPCYKELIAAFGRELDLTRAYDCCFVGYLNRGVPEDPKSHDRVLFLDKVFREFPNSWFAFNIFFEQAAIRYAKARVGLNISIRQDLNMRFFEALSYGVCQVCNRDMDGWKELGFVDGEDFLGWDTEEEAVERVRWALKNPEARERVAEAGLAKVRASHTYEHRVRELLASCGLPLPTP